MPKENKTGENMEIIGVLLVISLPVLYVLPTIIAYLTGHKNTLALFAFNLLLGWTLLGWVIALVWSLMKGQK